MRLIAVGRLRPGPESELFARYNARLRPPLTVTEVLEGHGAPAQAKRLEAAALLAAVPANGFVVALDSGGPVTDSPGLSALLERWLGLSRPLCFLIGGAEGLDASVLARADWSLSPWQADLAAHAGAPHASRAIIPRPRHRHRPSLPPRRPALMLPGRTQ